MNTTEWRKNFPQTADLTKHRLLFIASDWFFNLICNWLQLNKLLARGLHSFLWLSFTSTLPFFIMSSQQSASVVKIMSKSKKSSLLHLFHCLNKFLSVVCCIIYKFRWFKFIIWSPLWFSYTWTLQLLVLPVSEWSFQCITNLNVDIIFLELLENDVMVGA